MIRHVRAVDDFDSVFLAEYPVYVRLATAICGDVGRAEEVTQDAFASALPRWPELDSPGAYVRRAVVNGAIDERRRRSRRVVVPLRPDDEPEAPEVPDAPSHALEGALDALPPVQRAALALRYYADLPIAEVAATLGRPLNTVKSDLRRALASLATEVER